MKNISLTLLIGFALIACAGDETAATYAQNDLDYRLVELDGVPYANRATISFQQGGRISGSAPCNRYFGQLTVPYPWFGIENIGATLMACPDLAAESAFFDALESMSLAETSGNVLLLSNSDGRSMVFQAN